MANMLRYAFVFCAVFTSIHGYTLVLGQTGTCADTQAVTYDDFFMSTSSALQSGKFDYMVDCSMDMCTIPSTGRVAYGNVWSIDAEQTGSASSTRSMQYNRMTRRDCDAVRGTYQGNPTSNEMVDCGLFWFKMDGADRNNLVSLILGGPGSCDKIASIEIRMTQRNCVYASGTWSGNPGANDVIGCKFSVCMSPLVDCEPSDSWETIQTCENPSSVNSMVCEYSITTGVQNSQSSESSTGGDVSVTVGTEVTAQLGEIFSATVSTSVTTGYNWASVVSSDSVWSSESTMSYSVTLSAGQAVSIRQVKGECGDFTVGVPHYRVVDI